MKIKETKEFQVISISEKIDEISKILVENIKSKNQVEILGKNLEAQYFIGDDILFFVTNESPFEENLFIYYFDNNFKLKDRLELSSIYSAGLLNNLLIVDFNTIQFSFFESNDKWILKILPKCKYIIWANKYPVKRSFSFFKKNWLLLKRI